MQQEQPQVFTELAMCVQDSPLCIMVYPSGLVVRDYARRQEVSYGQRIHGRWINGLFYFPMSTSETEAATMIGYSLDFAPIIEE